MNLEDKKVVVMGLGLLGGGVGATKWLTEQGADVLVTDLKEKEELKPSLEELNNFDLRYVLGEHRPQDFKEADLIVKNPAVKKDSKYLQIARDNNIPIQSEISLFFKFCPCPIIGITGTKGKSTTATLIYKFLKQNNNVILGGNVNVETLPQLENLDQNSLAVLELSSWQLSGLDKEQMSPHLAVVTNVMKDHFNRYESWEDYIEDKRIIYKHQQPKDYLALNHRDPVSSRFSKTARAQVYYYNQKRSVDDYHNGARLEDDAIVMEEEICKKEDVKLIGSHNLTNVLAAITAARICDVSKENIKRVLKDFRGLPGRLEPVHRGKVDFYNDTCATNPDATMAALNSFEQPPVLIAGGAEKDLNFDDLAQLIAERIQALVLLKGEATPHLRKKVERALSKKDKKIPIEKSESMNQAVKLAYELAQPRGTVLMSPACATGGSQSSMKTDNTSHPPQTTQFDNEFDRGKKFKQAVRSLT